MNFQTFKRIQSYLLYLSPGDRRQFYQTVVIVLQGQLIVTVNVRFIKMKWTGLICNHSYHHCDCGHSLFNQWDRDLLCIFSYQPAANTTVFDNRNLWITRQGGGPRMHEDMTWNSLTQIGVVISGYSRWGEWLVFCISLWYPHVWL